MFVLTAKQLIKGGTNKIACGGFFSEWNKQLLLSSICCISYKCWFVAWYEAFETWVCWLLHQTAKIILFFLDMRRNGPLTLNVLSMQHIIPNLKRWDYSDTPSGGHKKINGPAHMAEGGHRWWYHVHILVSFACASSTCGSTRMTRWKNGDHSCLFFFKAPGQF